MMGKKKLIKPPPLGGDMLCSDERGQWELLSEIVVLSSFFSI